MCVTSDILIYFSLVEELNSTQKYDYLYTETNNKQKWNDEAKSKNNNTMIRTKCTCIKLRT